jgi:hypothetical protein
VDATLLGLALAVRYYAGNIRHGAEAGRAAALARRARGAGRLMERLRQGVGEATGVDRGGLDPALPPAPTVTPRPAAP